jgi:hypothetical protein
MAHVEDAIHDLARAFENDDPVTISAEHARTIHALITAQPAILAAQLADVAIDALFAARDAFWAQTADPESYWLEHRRLVRAVGAVVNVGWLEVKEVS